MLLSEKANKNNLKDSLQKQSVLQKKNSYVCKEKHELNNVVIVSMLGS